MPSAIDTKYFVVAGAVLLMLVIGVVFVSLDRNQPERPVSDPLEELLRDLERSPIPSAMLPSGFEFISSSGREFRQNGQLVSIGVVVAIDGPDDVNRITYQVDRTSDRALGRFKSLRRGERNVAPPRTRFFALPGRPNTSLCLENEQVGLQCYVLDENAIVRAESRKGPPGRAHGELDHVTALLRAGQDHLASLRNQ